MNLDFLETFLDVMETRNFGRTAERLDTRQSTVSARIRALESDVGVQLFVRGRAGAIPTAAGERFAQHARSLKSAWTFARQDTGATEKFDGTLRIAAQFSLMRTVLLDWAADLHQSGGRISLHIEADYSAQIVSDLANGNLDIGVLFAPRHNPDIRLEEIGQLRFVMVSTQPRFIGEIEADQYILPGYTSYFSRRHAELLPHLSQPSMIVGYEGLALDLLQRFGGATYLPVHLLAEYSGAQQMLPVEGAPEIIQPVFLAVQVRRVHEILIKRAIKSLKTIAATRLAS